MPDVHGTGTTCSETETTFDGAGGHVSTVMGSVGVVAIGVSIGSVCGGFSCSGGAIWPGSGRGILGFGSATGAGTGFVSVFAGSLTGSLAGSFSGSWPIEASFVLFGAFSLFGRGGM